MYINTSKRSIHSTFLLFLMTEGGMKEVCVAMMLHLLLLLYKCVFCLCR